jgi:hypothetical protein
LPALTSVPVVERNWKTVTNDHRLLYPVNGTQAAPTGGTVRWHHYALIGVGIMIGKTLVLSALLLVVDPSLRTLHVLGRIGVICLFLGLPGGVGGIAYAASQRFGAKYYTRWIVAAEVTLVLLLLGVNVLLSMFFRGQQTGTQEATLYLVTSPIGWMVLACFAAIGGLFYGKVLSD